MYPFCGTSLSVSFLEGEFYDFRFMIGVFVGRGKDVRGIAWKNSLKFKYVNRSS